MFDSAVLKGVHQIVNTRLYRECPSLDMANLEKHPDGHFKIWEIEMILQATYDLMTKYEEKKR